MANIVRQTRQYSNSRCVTGLESDQRIVQRIVSAKAIQILVTNNDFL